MPMTGKQRRHLRALAHGLDPVVALGRRGVTEGVVRNVEEALSAHELIKIRVGRECPLSRSACAELLAARTGAEVAGEIGHVILLYRADPERPRITLPGKAAPDTTTGASSR